MAPFFKTVDEEVESTHLKFLQTPPGITLLSIDLFAFKYRVVYGDFLSVQRELSPPYPTPLDTMF